MNYSKKQERLKPLPPPDQLLNCLTCVCKREEEAVLRHKMVHGATVTHFNLLGLGFSAGSSGSKRRGRAKYKIAEVV